MESEPLVGGTSIFAADKRRAVNSIPIFVNAILPWVVFTYTFYVWSFRFHFERAHQLIYVAALLVMVVAFPTYMAARLRRTSLNPTWFGYCAVSLLFASCLGVALGNENYGEYMQFYYKYDSLQSYPQVDVGREMGLHLLDAGRVYFGANARIDGKRSWHFKDGTMYCVAPIVSGSDETSTVDFWAVGADCCSESAPDFRCGEFSNPKARSGLRLLDDAVLPNYRLAAEQACELFGLHTTNPLFFTWTQDPVEEVLEYRNKGWAFFGLATLGFAVFSIISALLAAWKFSYIGRTPPQGPDATSRPHLRAMNGGGP